MLDAQMVRGSISVLDKDEKTRDGANTFRVIY